MPHRYAHEANIARYRQLLENESDPDRRAVLEQLLINEESGVFAAPDEDDDEDPATSS